MLLAAAGQGMTRTAKQLSALSRLRYRAGWPLPGCCADQGLGFGVPCDWGSGLPLEIHRYLLAIQFFVGFSYLH